MDKYLQVYQRELFQHVLPFWLKNSLDKKYGGYFTCLDAEGAVYDDRKYMWLQGRQVWMLAKLCKDCGPDKDWMEACELGAHFIRKYGRSPEGRVYFSVTREGRPFSLQRKIFSECFYVMALAAWYRLSGDATARAEALEVLELIEQLILDPARLGRPALAGQPGFGALAVPMIMLGLMGELDGVLDPEAIESKSHEYAAAMLQHYDPDLMLLRECIAPEPIGHWPEGRLINPGHSIEGGWFLLCYARRYGRPEMIARALDIIEGSLRFGWDPEFGGILYFMDAEAKPLPQLEWSMKLWWPHTEAICALVAAWCETENPTFRDWHCRVHDYSFEHFADHRHGEWFGYLDREGKRTHQSKGGAYKGCFHLPRALLFSIQELQERARRTEAAAAAAETASTS